MTHVLIAGFSTRAAAESAVRAGFAVTTIDAFADLDLHPAVRGLSLRRDFGASFTARAAARAATDVPCEAVVYASNFENDPGAVDTLASRCTLWGNPSSVLRRVRDPLQLASTFRQRGIQAPKVRMNGPNETNDPDDWLVKPVPSGGGHDVLRWMGALVSPGAYLQQRVEGVPGSVVFVAAGGRTVPLGVSRQLVGDEAFGAEGYRYCGSILTAAGDPQFDRDEALVDAASATSCAVTEEFGLVGLNGIDFIASGGVPHPIEVNPRWCASVELAELAYGVPMFGIHAAACSAGVLPAFDLARARRHGHAVGKAIVFARGDVTVGDTRRWLNDSTVSDVPRPGDRIAAGHPICTVLAEETDSKACYRALIRRAMRVYAELA